MGTRIPMYRPWKAAVLSLLVLAFPCTIEQALAREEAITWTVEDERLEWGPCPAFMPEGCKIAVLHGDPAKDNADIFFKVPANSTIPPHWHTSAERMVLISGKLHLTFDGQETFVLKPGTYVYGPPKLPHKGFCADAGPCVLFIAFELPVDAVPVDESIATRHP